MREILVNGRWPLVLPEHRAARPEWPWWEATRLASMHAHLAPGDAIYDVGAEEGDFPALWATWGCEVAMAEPNPRVWPNIRAIWEANSLRPPLTTWPGFLGDHVAGPAPDWKGDGSTPFAWPACAFGEIIGDHGFCQLGERPDIPMTTLDQLVMVEGEPAPDAITMDVEGSELHVLRGGAETLRLHRPKVWVSIHPAFMAHHYGIADGTAAVREFFAELGYRDTYLCTDHEEHWMFLP